MANGGTLFIDEVGEMPLSMQVKLLRVLQNQRFMRVGGTAEIISRFRLVAATNRDLRDEVAKGRFREDLFRLSGGPLRVPPLRERREDIIGLAEAFAESYCQRYGRPSLRLTDAERACLLNYSWPGNVRELKNIIERAVILNAPLLELVSPSRATASGSGAGAFIIPDFPTIPELEERYLRYVLERTGGKVCGPDGAESLLRLKRTLGRQFRFKPGDRFSLHPKRFLGHPAAREKPSSKSITGGKPFGQISDGVPSCWANIAALATDRQSTVVFRALFRYCRYGVLIGCISSV